MTTMAILVQAWRLGYNFGRLEAATECACQQDSGITPDNVRHLDNYRLPDQREGQ